MSPPKLKQMNEAKDERTKKKRKRVTEAVSVPDEKKTKKKKKKRVAEAVSVPEKKTKKTEKTRKRVSEAAVSVPDKNTEKRKRLSKAEAEFFKKRKWDLEESAMPKNAKMHDLGFVVGRFTPEEDQLVKDAVYNYIEANILGSQGLERVLNCKDDPDLRRPWQDIASSLPWTPSRAIYRRAHILFERSENRKWEPHEYETLMRLHKVYGPNWQLIAKELGKCDLHVNAMFRRLSRLHGVNRGFKNQMLVVLKRLTGIIFWRISNTLFFSVVHSEKSFIQASRDDLY